MTKCNTVQLDEQHVQHDEVQHMYGISLYLLCVFTLIR